MIWVWWATHLIFGLVRGTGPFTTVLPTFVLLPRMQLVEQYRGHDHFLRVESSSRHEGMVGGVLARDSDLRVGLGVSGATIVSGPVWIVCSPISFVDFSLFALLPSSLSLGISSLFGRATQCM